MKMSTHTYLTLTRASHCYATSCAAHNEFMSSLYLISLLRLTFSQPYSRRSFSHLRLCPSPHSPLLLTVERRLPSQQQRGTASFLSNDSNGNAAAPSLLGLATNTLQLCFRSPLAAPFFDDSLFVYFSLFLLIEYNILLGGFLFVWEKKLGSMCYWCVLVLWLEMCFIYYYYYFGDLVFFGL